MHKQLNKEILATFAFKKNVSLSYSENNCAALSGVRRSIRDNKDNERMILEFIPQKLAVLSNFTVDNINDYLDLAALSKGVNLSIYYPGFNQYQFEIINNNSMLYKDNPDTILLLIDETAIFGDFAQLVDATDKMSAFADQYLAILSKLRDKSNATIIINTIAISEVVLDSIIDYESKSKLLLEVLHLNQRIIEFSLSSNDVVVIDTNMLLQNRDVLQLRDERLALFAKMQFDDNLLNSFAKEVIKVLTAKTGLTKKCIVLDLDNTLWGGILGDDGTSGIDLGSTINGNEFKQLQQILNRLKHQGVLLAINSKNDHDNVKDVFLNHDEMILNYEDFIGIKANWQNKHENIIDIARESNFSTNTMVFIDDSEVECNLIESFLPEVEVLCAKDGPLTTLIKLLAAGWFNKLKSSKEDLVRTEMYHNDKARSTFLNSQDGSVDEFLRQLDTVVTIFFAEISDLPRIHQMCQRTNQFNLTNKRYSELEIKEFIEDDESAIIAVDVKDKFGSYGTVAAAFIKNYAGDALAIENFLMSCRVFSRKVETALITAILKYAWSKKIQLVRGFFAPSAKNSKTCDFYSKEGFELESRSDINSIFKIENYSNKKYPDVLIVRETL